MSSRSLIQRAKEALSRATDRFKTRIQEFSSWSKHIPESVTAEPARQDESTGVIVSEISVGGETAPYAKYFEYGTGLYNKQNPRKYRIPKFPKSRVAFPKSRWPQFVPQDEAPDVFVFHHVMHPGVRPRPFVRPAKEVSLPEMKSSITSAVVDGIKEDYINPGTGEYDVDIKL